MFRPNVKIVLILSQSSLSNFIWKGLNNILYSSYKRCKRCKLLFFRANNTGPWWYRQPKMGKCYSGVSIIVLFWTLHSLLCSFPTHSHAHPCFHKPTHTHTHTNHCMYTHTQCRAHSSSTSQTFFIGSTIKSFSVSLWFSHLHKLQFTQSFFLSLSVSLSPL